MSKWITTSEAASKAFVNRMTVVLWCKKYPGLAKKVGGRWRVDEKVLDSMVEGRYDKESHE